MCLCVQSQPKGRRSHPTEPVIDICTLCMWLCVQSQPKGLSYNPTKPVIDIRTLCCTILSHWY